jgi:hypothetical protein
MEPNCASKAFPLSLSLSKAQLGHFDTETSY